VAEHFAASGAFRRDTVERITAVLPPGATARGVPLLPGPMNAHPYGGRASGWFPSRYTLRGTKTTSGFDVHEDSGW
jgi:hypothetical protein